MATRAQSLLLQTFVVLLSGLLPSTASAQKAVFVVRHAERLDSSQDSPLSDRGKARAEALARHLKDAGVRTIYTTQFQRTRATVAPLAKALGLEPLVVSGPTADLVARIRKAKPDEVVLVAGHSNTVPEILKLLGHADPVTIADDEFDALFVVVPGTQLTVLRLRY